MLPRTLAALMILALPLMATAEEIACNESGTQGELNACSADALKKTDEEMNRLYNQKMKTLKSEDDKIRLRAAQRSWLKFRDDSCFYEWGKRTPNSGSQWSMQYNDCLEAFTKKRVSEMQGYVSCTKPEDACGPV